MLKSRRLTLADKDQLRCRRSLVLCLAKNNPRSELEAIWTVAQVWKIGEVDGLLNYRFNPPAVRRWKCSDNVI